MEVTAYGSDFVRRASIANESGKIFHISKSFDVPQVRQELIKRGFIERKATPYNSTYFSVNSSLELCRIKNINEFEQVILHKICGNRNADFVWVSRKEHYHLYSDSALLNRIYVYGWNFTNKDDLCEYVNRIGEIMSCKQDEISKNEFETYSNCDDRNNNNKNDKIFEGNTEICEETNNKFKCDNFDALIKFTRTYNVIDESVERTFKKDFRLGCVLGLVTYLSSHSNVEDCFVTYSADSDPKKVEGERLKVLDLAFYIIRTHVKAMNDLTDKHITERNCDLKDTDWIYVCRAHYNIVRLKKKLKALPELVDVYIARIRYMAEVISHYWPERNLDGCNNVWLLKPVDSGNGYGIVLLDTERKILNLATSKKRKYILQKYIERPLLIYNHKFDIRQYYLISIANNKYRCWSHCACTIKFATEPFTLDVLNEAVHITNVAIQRRFQRKPNRNLPTNNTWSIEEFVEYLSSVGECGDAWQQAIYPAIKKTLSYVSEVSYKDVEMKNGRFELLGCDFLVTEDYRTCLLEINRSPSMKHYTPIHARVLEEVLADLMKVVIDYPKDEGNVSTGRFELVYEKDFLA